MTLRRAGTYLGLLLLVLAVTTGTTAADVRARVVDSRGRPILGAVVGLAQLDNAEGWKAWIVDPDATTTTDSSGEYVFRNSLEPDRRYSVEARVGGKRARSDPFGAQTGQVTVRLSISSHSATSESGLVGAGDQHALDVTERQNRAVEGEAAEKARPEGDVEGAGERLYPDEREVEKARLEQEREIEGLWTLLYIVIALNSIGMAIGILTLAVLAARVRPAVRPPPALEPVGVDAESLRRVIKKELHTYLGDPGHIAGQTGDAVSRLVDLRNDPPTAATLLELVTSVAQLHDDLRALLESSGEKLPSTDGQTGVVDPGLRAWGERAALLYREMLNGAQPRSTPLYLKVDKRSYEGSDVARVRRFLGEADGVWGPFVAFPSPDGSEALVFPNPRLEYSEDMNVIFRELHQANAQTLMAKLSPKRAVRADGRVWEVLDVEE